MRTSARGKSAGPIHLAGTPAAGQTPSGRGGNAMSRAAAAGPIHQPGVNDRLEGGKLSENLFKKLSEKPKMRLIEDFRACNKDGCECPGNVHMRPLGELAAQVGANAQTQPEGNRKGERATLPGCQRDVSSQVGASLAGPGLASPAQVAAVPAEADEARVASLKAKANVIESAQSAAASPALVAEAQSPALVAEVQDQTLDVGSSPADLSDTLPELKRLGKRLAELHAQHFRQEISKAPDIPLSVKTRSKSVDFDTRVRVRALSVGPQELCFTWPERSFGRHRRNL